MSKIYLFFLGFLVLSAPLANASALLKETPYSARLGDLRRTLISLPKELYEKRNLQTQEVFDDLSKEQCAAVLSYAEAHSLSEGYISAFQDTRRGAEIYLHHYPREEFEEVIASYIDAKVLEKLWIPSSIPAQEDKIKKLITKSLEAFDTFFGTP